jgi:hypothetical protein
VPGGFASRSAEEPAGDLVHQSPGLAVPVDEDPEPIAQVPPQDDPERRRRSLKSLGDRLVDQVDGRHDPALGEAAGQPSDAGPGLLAPEFQQVAEARVFQLRYRMYVTQNLPSPLA